MILLIFAILLLANRTLAQHARPRNWNTQDIVPIPKYKEANSYRPISLLSCIEKTVEKMVLNRLKWKVGPLHPQLYAYRGMVGTTECIMDFLSFVNGKKAIVVFLDLEKAFELVNPSAMLTSLVEKGIAGNLLAWVQAYCQNRRARVRFQGSMSSYKDLEYGTPQGGILSPYLFNVHMDNIASLPRPRNVEIFIYADDIAIVSKGPNCRTNAQKALNTIQKSCTHLGFKINVRKTKAMAIKMANPRPISIHQQDLEWVDDFTYLGVTVQKTLSSSLQIQRLKQMTKTKTAPMRYMQSLDAGASPLVLEHYYKYCIRPIIEYRAPVLSHLTSQQEESLEVAQNNALRLILGAPMWTRKSNLQMESGIPPLMARIQTRNCTAAAKALLSDRDSHLRTKLKAHLDAHPDLPRPDTYVGHLGDQIRATGMEGHLKALKPNRACLKYRPPAPWASPTTTFNHTQLPHAKNHCSLGELRDAARTAIQATESQNGFVCYTDGTVDPENGITGAGVYSATYTAAWRTSDHCSTLQTELVAMQKALEYSSQLQGPVVIHTDSLAVTQVLQKKDIPTNINIITTILYLLQLHNRQNRPVIINWIPSHIVVHGNERADEMAKAARYHPHIEIKVQPSTTLIKSWARDHLQRTKVANHRRSINSASASAKWYERATKLCPHPATKIANRGLSVIIHRLRLGYKCCWEIIERQERECDHCGMNTSEPLLHYLLECAHTIALRREAA
ncbi:uncharacterized protein LOC143038790 [Oratosquilla oratoria]|uniref:uncharacterized protein LOC143038790 n=1 Tax=Oratosquilla oratoria TaxID=337810 RepID=UPI003F76C34C